MVLNSLRFALFFLIFGAVLLLLPGKLRKYWLLLGNAVFYLSWGGSGAILLLFSILVVWACGLGIERRGKKRLLLVLPVLWNAALLLFFKYSGLFGKVLTRAGAAFLPNVTDIIVPLGISFYTLRCISFVTAVYRGTLPAKRSLADTALYVSFFPQMISGPIEKPEPFFRELEAFETKALWDPRRIRRGGLLFVWGLFKKLVLAERLVIITTGVFSNFQSFGFREILLASIAYTLQIYCDFSAYSDMSRAVSAMISFSTMRNFRQPYLAAGIRDFWRRWHISFSAWLTDHVYIPLGGSRRGVLRRYFNILVTFFVSGMWHGDTLNFIFWGLLHGCFQITEDLRIRAGIRFPKWLSHIILLAEVNFAWIFFNAGGLNRGFRIIRQMFTRWSAPMEPLMVPGNWVVLGVGLLILAAVDILQEKHIAIFDRAEAMPLPLRWLLYLGLIWSVIMLGIYGVGYDTSGFIYAQF